VVREIPDDVAAYFPQNQFHVFLIRYISLKPDHSYYLIFTKNVFIFNNNVYKITVCKKKVSKSSSVTKIF